MQEQLDRRDAQGKVSDERLRASMPSLSVFINPQAFRTPSFWDFMEVSFT